MHNARMGNLASHSFECCCSVDKSAQANQGMGQPVLVTNSTSSNAHPSTEYLSRAPSKIRLPAPYLPTYLPTHVATAYALGSLRRQLRTTRAPSCSTQPSKDLRFSPMQRQQLVVAPPRVSESRHVFPRLVSRVPESNRAPELQCRFCCSQLRRQPGRRWLDPRAHQQENGLPGSLQPVCHALIPCSQEYHTDSRSVSCS